MAPRHLSYVAIAGAAVIVVVSFGLSAGAVIDHAQDIGVDARLATALPICVEALIVVSGAVMVARRIDPTAERSKLAWCVFFAGVAITVWVNWQHGGPDTFAAFLSALPALSLPTALHLALEEWLRVRNTAEKRPVKARAKRQSRKAPVTVPAVSASAPRKAAESPRETPRVSPVKGEPVAHRVAMALQRYRVEHPETPLDAVVKADIARLAETSPASVTRHWSAAVDALEPAANGHGPSS